MAMQCPLYNKIRLCVYVCTSMHRAIYILPKMYCSPQQKDDKYEYFRCAEHHVTTNPISGVSSKLESVYFVRAGEIVVLRKCLGRPQPHKIIINQMFSP